MTKDPRDKKMAVLAESLYLLNLLFPILPYLFLWLLYLRNKDLSRLFLYCHLLQSLIYASLTTLLFLIIVAITWFSGASQMDNWVNIYSLVALEVYIIGIVIPFAIPGLLGLTRAMSEQCYRYPFIGKFL